MKTTHYAILADLFDFPRPSFSEKVRHVQDFLRAGYPEAGKNFDKFMELMPVEDIEQMGELFTRSFDVQAVTTLDLGYILFGDDYKRGELLANLNREHREAENDCGGELADHLPNVLRLIARLKNRELICELVQEIVAPALQKMIQEFQPERLKQRNAMYKKHYKTLLEFSEERYTLYLHCLRALDKMLRADFSIYHKFQTEKTSDFLKCLESEMKIEEDVGS